MINYTSSNQQKLDLFKNPFEKNLDPNNRWVKLSSLIPWDSLANQYIQKMNSRKGRKSVNVRTVIGALIIKHKLKLSDRGTLEMIQENIYMQYFCGLESFTTKPVFDSSLFVDIRKRLGSQEFEKFNNSIIESAENINRSKSRSTREDKNDTDINSKANLKRKGTLKVDATVADQEISYPNDVKLLNQCREYLEKLIHKLYQKDIDGSKPRLYKRNARRDYLGFSMKKRKSKKEIRKGRNKQIQYVRRDLKILESFLSNSSRAYKLSNCEKEKVRMINKIYAQQLFMHTNRVNRCDDRIVNLHQSFVRVIPRGKENSRYEFGSKLNIGLRNGFISLDRLSWNAFNEGCDIKLQVENYRKRHGYYPKFFLGDKIYLNKENRKYLDRLGIKYLGKPLGRPAKKKTKNSSKKYREKKKMNERNRVEGVFGVAKRKYDLNCIKARLKETSESWVNIILFVMNLDNLLRIAEKNGVFLFHFLKYFLNSIKNKKVELISLNSTLNLSMVG
jgi:hypothetical protein